MIDTRTPFSFITRREEKWLRHPQRFSWLRVYRAARIKVHRLHEKRLADVHMFELNYQIAALERMSARSDLEEQVYVAASKGNPMPEIDGRPFMDHVFMVLWGDTEETFDKPLD